MNEATKQKLRDNMVKAREARRQKLEKKNNRIENEFVDELDPRYASKTDINQLAEALTQIAKTVDDLAQKQANPVIIEKIIPEIAGTADMSKIKESTSVQTPVMKPTDEEIIAGIEKIPVPPAWRKMVDEFLGMDFGIDVVYPQAGSGFLFKIIVPAEKSNMSKDYKEFYKVDIRTKAINYNEGIDGIRKFCEGVKKNLEKKQTV